MNKSLPVLLLAASFAFSTANAQTGAAADKAVAAPDAAPAPAPDATAPAEPSLVSDFAYSGGNTDAEVVTGTKKGMKVYKDNDLVFPDLPPYLTGITFIRPYLSDAAEGSSTDQYQMNVTRYCHVYLAIDSANDMPANNDNDTYKWEKLPETLTLNNRPMTIYRSRLMAPYDVVYLATNGHGIDKFDPKSNMYLLFIKLEEIPLVKPGLTATASSSDAANPPALAIDGKKETFWKPAADSKNPQWIKIDLGQKCDVGGYLIDWHHDAGAKLKSQNTPCLIEISDDDKTYRVSTDQKTKPQPDSQELRVSSLNVDSSKGRYIRITVTGDEPAAINEIRINGVVDIPPAPAAPTPPDKAP